MGFRLDWQERIHQNYSSRQSTQKETTGFCQLSTPDLKIGSQDLWQQRIADFWTAGFVDLLQHLCLTLGLSQNPAPSESGGLRLT